MKIKKIIVVAQIPPPYHGQSVMTEYFLEGKYTKIQLDHIRMGFSGDIDEVGRAGIGKIFHLFGLILRILLARFKTGAPVLYFPPAGPNWVPFLRDCAILILVRPFFKETVFHFHAAGLSTLYERLPGPLKLLFRMAYFRPSGAITISQDGIRDARFLQASNVTLVPNGVPDVAAGFPTSDTKPASILFLGMVCEEKGVGVLIDALHLLQERGVQFRCIIAGKASSEGELEQLQRRAKGVESNIAFLGPVVGTNKWELFAASQIFCFPTFYSSESFGLVAVEAMMFGLPVVASNWRALPEIVKEGETGFLTPVRDPEATADCLERLLTDAGMRKRMGEAGRQRFLQNYRVDVFQKGMEDALR